MEEARKMKKKVEDLTVGKVYEYCKEKESCDDCPFRTFFYYCTLNSPYNLEEETLEQEIEIPEGAE